MPFISSHNLSYFLFFRAFIALIEINFPIFFVHFDLGMF